MVGLFQASRRQCACRPVVGGLLLCAFRLLVPSIRKRLLVANFVNSSEKLLRVESLIKYAATEHDSR